MKKVFLISCVSKKLPYKAKASELYISTLFKLCLKYAKQQRPNAIYILSAKYGLLDLDDEIEPYDTTLNDMKINEIKNWAEITIKKLREITDLKTDVFVLLAGKNYRKFLIPYLPNYQIPMEGLPIGKQLHYLKQKVQIMGANMDNTLEWKSIWREMQDNLISQPPCPDHPEYPYVKSLAQGVINDIIEVDEEGVRLRSHRTGNEDFIGSERLEIWWNHLLDNKSASLVPGTPNNPYPWRARIVGAIIAIGLPNRIKIADTKTIELIE